ncbi:hypothetical protein BCR39DRAFT_562486 [Naematelia encephala]|uniref:Uncharacterized protein n=1 Tax=Naematelia encephala TaxID=71784 RepID=A0A1Y2AHK9_9TREE|nr:hypothetical protein BCR39DRAFT_562486 [Naematelia encephala]
MSDVATAAASGVVVAPVEVDPAVAPAASDAPAAAVPAAPPAPEVPILSSRYNLRLTSHRFANLPRSTASPSVLSKIFSSATPSLPASSRASSPVSVTGTTAGLLPPVEIRPPPLDGHRVRSSTKSSSSSSTSSGSSPPYLPPGPEAEKGQESDEDESDESLPSPVIICLSTKHLAFDFNPRAKPHLFSSSSGWLDVDASFNGTLIFDFDYFLMRLPDTVDKLRFGKGKARARPSKSSTRRRRSGSLLKTVTPSIENAAKRVRTTSSRLPRNYMRSQDYLEVSP